MDYLERSGPDRIDREAVPVVALVHNEANILPAFLAHYRGLGRVTFLIVDDRSTDGTAALLAAQPDVTVFRPVEGSSYRAHKALWRSQLLDRYADGRWCLVPDLDEHFVFAGQPGLSLEGYIAALEGEGAQAVATLMIDMYDDRPLGEHIFPDGQGRSLTESFPYFDGPAPFPEGYALRPVTRATLKRFPTPPVAFVGGARHRLFYPRPTPSGPVSRWVASHRFGFDGAVNARPGRLARSVAKRLFAGTLNCTKLGLLRWRRGWQFNGGAHKLDAAIPMSESIAAFLHYPFTRGREGIEYIAKRGQHADGSGHYKRLLDGEGLAQSPVYAGSKRYTGPEALAGLIRGVPGR
ncbi:glycosyltransferase family 2 protein [Salipiger sp. P9]|uniref:glycosyltransferase family 2 protein n=1 Tax=Salipiger pentaromativorans TaxID=2943193 RepID=UPI00215788CA|nr:glycosyltransferase family 2 protein [Salipiger pentaromativorans]